MRLFANVFVSIIGISFVGISQDINVTDCYELRFEYREIDTDMQTVWQVYASRREKGCL